MARIKPECVEAVKAAADILDVVGARTQLRKSGARYTGRCPFHEERTASFSVNAVDKLYHCFGCQAGGDVVTFVRETENLDFAGAIEWLADRFRVPLEYEDESPQVDAARRRRRRLLDVLEQAAAFYERVLWDTKAGEGVRAYLAERRLGEEVCRELRLGLAPTGGRSLGSRAQEKGFTRGELQEAGLVNRSGRDYFPAGRLMFPLCDVRGRVIGFGARRLREDDPIQAKYVNSPESQLFRKGSLLYGLHRSREAVAKAGYAIVVEGYTDVLALRQGGILPVVASMGTALTEAQLKEIARLARRVYLCFDADAAGEAATLRGMDLAYAQGLDVRIVPLPAGLDPADAAPQFPELMSRARTYVVHRVLHEIERAADRQEAFVRVREALAGFEDSPERQDAIRLAADRLDLPPDLQAGLAPRASAATGIVSDRVIAAGDQLELDVLAAFVGRLLSPELLRALSADHFHAEQHRAVRAHVVDAAPLPDELIGLLAALDARVAERAIDEATAKELVLRLRQRHLRREIARAGDAVRIKELQEELDRIQRALDDLA